MNIPNLLCLAQGSKFIDAGEVIAGYDDYIGTAPDLGWRESAEDVPTAISIDLSGLNGARRLNVYTLGGRLVGMVNNGCVDALNLPNGIYIIRDFDTNKAVKIRM